MHPPDLTHPPAPRAPCPQRPGPRAPSDQGPVPLSAQGCPPTPSAQGPVPTVRTVLGSQWSLGGPHLRGAGPEG